MTAQGSNFKLRMHPETTFGTFPTAVNFNQVPVFSFAPSRTQALDQDALLSSVANRDAGDPFYGLIRVEGAVEVPIDTVHFARWLRLLLGAPATTGSSPNFTHVFTSGSAALPSNGLEAAYPDLTTPLFMQLAGVRQNTLSVSLGPDGAARATCGLMALSETKATSTGAGTPAVTAFERFFNVQGEISRGGSVLGGVTACDFTFTNDMEMIAAVRDDFRMEDIDFGLAAATGTVTARFNDAALYDAAVASAAPAALTYGYEISATKSVLFNFGRTFLAQQGRPVSGPRGITQQFRWVAGPHASTGVMQVTVKNQIADYTTA